MCKDLLTALSLIVCLIAFQTTDSLSNNPAYSIILDIGDYNDDMSQDTLIGISSQSKTFHPHMILWGKDSTIHIDPLLYPKVDTTKFIYPNWNNLRVNYMVNKFNQDTIIDMIFIISGKIQIDSTSFKDTSSAIIIFGQCGLDTIPEINLSLIAMQQIFPFKARHLVHGQDIINCTLRGERHRSFYELPKLYDQLLPPPPNKHACVNCNHEFKISAKIYPIPSESNINIILSGLEVGRYLLKIVDINARSVHNQLIDISVDEQHFEVHPNNLPTGVYILMIEDDGTTIFTKKFIIRK